MPIIERTMGYILARNAALYRDKEALVFGARRWSWHELAMRAGRLARGLEKCGLDKGDRFSVLAMNCGEYVEAYGAAELAGFVLATVNFRLTPLEMEWIIGDTAPKALLFEEQYADVVNGLRPKLPSVTEYICIGNPPSWARCYEDVLESGEAVLYPPRAQPDDPLALIYTSGTTGRPKGVIQSNRAVFTMARGMGVELGMHAQGRSLASMPFFHIGARSSQVAQHWRGGTLVLHRSFEPEEIIRTIEREAITLVHLAPTMLQSVLDAPNFGLHDLSSLETVLYAAAPMPVSLLRRAVAAFGPILMNGYGQTESNGAAFLHKHQHVLDGTPQQQKRLASVGQPSLENEIKIVNDEGAVLGANHPGEIYIRSETNMSGYWNNSIATIETLRDGWVATGDIGYLDEDGFLFLVDRKKDMIISGGENIYCREVEEALSGHPAIHDVAVIGVPDAKWGEAVKAIVVLKPGATIDDAGLIAHCRTQIAGYKCPKSVDFIDELPRLASGKVKKNELRDRYKTPSLG